MPSSKRPHTSSNTASSPAAASIQDLSPSEDLPPKRTRILQQTPRLSRPGPGTEQSPTEFPSSSRLGRTSLALSSVRPSAGNVKSLTDGLATIKTTVANLKDTVDRLENRYYPELAEGAEDLGIQVDNIDSNVAEIHAIINEIDGEIGGLQGNLTGLDKRIGTLEEEMCALREMIMAGGGQIPSVGATVNGGGGTKKRDNNLNVSNKKV